MDKVSGQIVSDFKMIVLFFHLEFLMYMHIRT